MSAPSHRATLWSVGPRAERSKLRREPSPSKTSSVVLATILAIVAGLAPALRSDRGTTRTSARRTPTCSIAQLAAQPLPALQKNALPYARSRPRDVSDEPALALTLARVEGTIVVRGGGSAERFERMSVLVHSSSGRGTKARIDAHGAFTAELRLPATDCERPLTVSLDTEAGQRLRRELTLEPLHASADGGTECLGRIAIELAERSVVRGTVAAAEDGKALAGATVALISLAGGNRAGEVLVEAVTGADGRFWLEAPPQHDLLLAVVHRDRKPGARVLTSLEPAEHDVGSVALARGERIAGTVLLNDVERARGVSVWAHCRADGAIQLGSGDQSFSLGFDGVELRHRHVYSELDHSAVDDARFELAGLEGGEYEIELTRPEGYCRLPGLADTATRTRANDTLLLDPQTPEVWVVVHDEESGSAVRATVRVAGEFGELSLPTDRLGVGLILTAAETHYRLTVEAPGYERAELELRSPAKNGCDEQLVGLRRMPTGTLVLVLEPPWNGQATARLTRDDATTEHDVDVVDGRVELGALPAGLYECELDLGGTVALSADAREPRHTFATRVEAGASLEQRVSLH